MDLLKTLKNTQKYFNHFFFVVEYITCALILSMLSTLHSIIIAVLSRSTTQPPLSYTSLVQKIPRWILIILVLDTHQTAGQSFTFSELVESDSAQTSETTWEDSEKVNSHQPWKKHVVLFDRAAFYLFGLVTCLLIVSILFTE